MTPLVLVEESPSAGSRHEVQPGATIGREGCEVVLADPEVSRNHARIRSLDAGLAIEDLESTNGTFLNGERLTGLAELTHGDLLKLGNSLLRVEVEAEHGATRLTPVPAEAEAAPPAPEPEAEAIAAAPTPEPAKAEAVAAAEPPEPAAPAAPEPPAAAAPVPPEPEAARGDVPPPPPASASRVHQAFAPARAAAPEAFQIEEPRRRRGSAATRVEATVVSYAIVIATAVAVALYLVQRT